MQDDGRHTALGLDLGRHRAYVAAATLWGGVEAVRLCPQHLGLPVRLAGRTGPGRRPLDVLARLDDRSAALEVATRALAAVAGPVQRSAPALLALPVALAAPAGWDGGRRQRLVAAARRAGLDAAPHRIVARSEAVLAAWLAGGAAAPDDGLVVTVDVDAGACSASVSGTGPAGGFVTSADLGLWLEPGPAAAAALGAGLRRLVQLAAALAHPADHPVRGDDWASVAGRVATVATAGTGAHHPALLRLLRRLFPGAGVGPLQAVDPRLAVAAGLARLDAVAELRPVEPRFDLVATVPPASGAPAGPTRRRLLVPAATPGWAHDGDPWGLQAGRAVTLAHPGGRRGVTARLRALAPDGRRLAFVVEGRPLDHLGLLLRPDATSGVELLVDGRLLLRHGEAPPVVVRLAWAPLGRPLTELGVTPVGRRPLRLGPVPASGPEAVHHVEPELRGEPQRLDVDPLVVAVEPAEELARPH